MSITTTISADTLSKTPYSWPRPSALEDPRKVDPAAHDSAVGALINLKASMRLAYVLRL